MRFATLAFAGLFGSLVLTSDASACHKKKCACAPTTTVVCEPAPVKVKKVKMAKCHKAKATCAPVAYAPTTYAAPMSYASPQASAQAPMGTMQAPAKSM